MARRRLEAAIQAGKFIDDGAPLPSAFSQVDVAQTYFFGEEKDGLYSLQHSYDGALLAVGYGDGGIELVNTATGKKDKELRKHKYGAMAVTCIRFSPKEPSYCYAGTSEGNVHACSVENTTIQDVIYEAHNEINCLDFCMDGTAFATAGKDLDIRIYDSDTAKRLMTLSGFHVTSPEKDVSGHAHRIFALKFHPDNNDVFVSGGWDNHLKIWDARAEGVMRTVPGPHICGDSLDIRGTEILTGSWTAHDAVQLWDFGSGKLIRSLPLEQGPEAEGEFVYCCQFCDGGVVLAGGSGTASVQALSVDDGKVLGEVPLGRPIQALDSFNGGRQFAYGGTGTQLKLAKLS